MKKKCLRIGLTGGIATGKSSVAEILKKQGVPVVEADKISRSLATPGSKAVKLIEEAFGTDFINSNGTLKRKKISDTVFNNPVKRELLNSVLHPLILEKLWTAVVEIEKSGKPSIITVDIPLLFECGLQKSFDVIVVVTADLETRIKRIMQRDGLSRKQSQKIIEAQIPCSQKTELADYVINNSTSREALEQKTLEILNKIFKSTVTCIESGLNLH